MYGIHNYMEHTVCMGVGVAGQRSLQQHGGLGQFSLLKKSYYFRLKNRVAIGIVLVKLS